MSVPRPGRIGHGNPVSIKNSKTSSRQGGIFEFRHDRVRDYLAAKYFSSRWRTILKDEKTTVDVNWDTMLQLHLAVEQNEGQTKELVFLLLKKDMSAAIRLNSWGRQNRPAIFSNWQDEFAAEVGHTVLGPASSLCSTSRL